ncbi:MAG: hypothetical protein K6G80_11450 [Treponema sp.]|nr:hypothetical protein [Treponema sp.]
MREIEKHPARMGVIGTAGIWLLFILLGLLLPFFPKREYKTIQIRLDAPQTVQKTPRQEAPVSAPAAEAPVMAETVTSPPPAPAAEPAPKAESPKLAKADSAPAPQPAPAKPSATSKPAPAKPPKASEPKKTAASKPAPAKPQPTTPAPAKTTPTPAPAQQTLQKSVEQLMAEQQQTKKQKKAVDWDNLFGDDAPAAASSTASSAKPVQIARVDSLQGEAATNASTAGGTGSAGASSRSKNSREAASTASSATSAVLANIAATTFTAPASNGVSSQVSANTVAGNDGRISMQMSDGSSRVLLEPAKPVIELSPAAAATIDGQKTVKITFIVLPDGTVPISDIHFTPESVIKQLVQREVAAQVARWRFSSASTSARAVFDYTIKMK